jgi:hypothetical protein
VLKIGVQRAFAIAGKKEKGNVRYLMRVVCHIAIDIR